MVCPVVPVVVFAIFTFPVCVDNKLKAVVGVEVSIDVVNKFEIVSVPWAVGYVKKLLFAVVSVK